MQFRRSIPNRNTANLLSSPGFSRIRKTWSIHVVVMHRRATKLTNIDNSSAQSLFCSLRLLFGDVLVAVWHVTLVAVWHVTLVVVSCYSSADDKISSQATNLSQRKLRVAFDIVLMLSSFRFCLSMKFTCLILSASPF